MSGLAGLYLSAQVAGNTEAPAKVSAEIPLPEVATPQPAEPTAPLETQAPAIQPAAEPELATGHEAAEPQAVWSEHKIQPGENLALIFKQMNLGAGLLHNIVHSSKTAQQLARIRPGETLRFQLSPDNELQTLELQHNRIESLRISAADEGFQAEVLRKDVERRTASAHGSIASSLFVDGQSAGLSDAQIMELAGIFGWDIDFALELRSGDQFSLIYEEQFLDGEKLRNGPILAAEFINRGTVYRAVRFEDKDGNVGYYDPEGRNKRRAFIRTPVKFARISSGFTTKRWHPVLQKWRSHKGVDYAAPTGTPIKATGAGKVVFRGWKGGYGRVVIIEHGGRKYTTLYGHMSKFAGKVKTGSKVKQGQVIGYVGMSGLATGPHLHYEFRVNGVHRNPLTVKLPKSLPLPKTQLAEFKRQSHALLAQLDSLDSNIMVAEADTSPTHH